MLLSSFNVCAGETLELDQMICFKYPDKQGKKQRVHIVEKIAPQWKEVGILLNFSISIIDSIATSCHHKPVECSTELLTKWLQGYNTDSKDSSPKTWETLLEVMRDAHLGELANELESILTS